MKWTCLNYLNFSSTALRYFIKAYASVWVRLGACVRLRCTCQIQVGPSTSSQILLAAGGDLPEPQTNCQQPCLLSVKVNLSVFVYWFFTGRLVRGGSFTHQFPLNLDITAILFPNVQHLLLFYLEKCRFFSDINCDNINLNDKQRKFRLTI